MNREDTVSLNFKAMRDVRILRIDQKRFVNDSPYVDYLFEGGLFAAVNVYLEEDLAECFQALISYFDDSQSYEVDYTHRASPAPGSNAGKVIVPDERRELFSLLLPVKSGWPLLSILESPRK